MEEGLSPLGGYLHTYEEQVANDCWPALARGVAACSGGIADRWDVVISYCRIDGQQAEDICKLLRAENWRVFFDQGGSIEAGENWPAKISEAIEQCRVVLILVSSNALRSGHFWRREIEMAVVTRRRIIPLVLDDCKLPQEIADLQAIDWSKPERFWDLHRALTRILS